MPMQSISCNVYITLCKPNRYCKVTPTLWEPCIYPVMLPFLWLNPVYPVMLPLMLCKLCVSCITFPFHCATMNIFCNVTPTLCQPCTSCNVTHSFVSTLCILLIYPTFVNSVYWFHTVVNFPHSGLNNCVLHSVECSMYITVKYLTFHIMYTVKPL